MNLNLEAKYVYDVVEATLKDCRDNPELYVVAGDKRMAIRKSYIRSSLLPDEACSITLGITKNRSQIYVEFTGQYSSTKQIEVSRPWLKGRRYHNKLLSEIRKVAYEIDNRQLIAMRLREMEEFVREARSAIPGALNNAIDDVLINGDKKC